MCNDEIQIIQQSDFTCIGEVATHCDKSKLCIAINEASKFDMEALFCGFWQDILAIDAEITVYDVAYSAYLIESAECEADTECATPPVAPVIPQDYDLKKALICGGTYESCNGKTRNQYGVKNVFVYYSYSRYVMINGNNDTPSGMVTKTNEFSIPVPVKDLERISDRYRTMGYESFKGVQSFLCANKTVFTDFDSRECKACGCGGNCDEKTKAKGYGFKSSVISKELPNRHYHNGRL